LTAVKFSLYAARSAEFDGSSTNLVDMRANRQTDERAAACTPGGRTGGASLVQRRKGKGNSEKRKGAPHRARLSQLGRLAAGWRSGATPSGATPVWAAAALAVSR